MQNDGTYDHRGVYAVPPVARRIDDARSIHPEENARILRHIAEGGVRRILYGGNGNLYHISMSDYEQLLDCLSDWSDTLTIVPSVGPAYGRAMDQAAVLRRHRFPFVMALPCNDPRTAAGLTRGYREIARAAGIPLLLYLKSEDNLGPDVDAGLDAVAELIDDGVAIGVKYAIVRKDPGDDAYLQGLLSRVEREVVISGLGERPAVIHMEEWRLPGFTTGSGCINPKHVQALYEAAQRGDFVRAREYRSAFMPLEDLRDRWGPGVVLHEAVESAGIARVGPHVPFLSELTADQREEVGATAGKLAELSVDALEVNK